MKPATIVRRSLAIFAALDNLPFTERVETIRRSHCVWVVIVGLDFECRNPFNQVNWFTMERTETMQPAPNGLCGAGKPNGAKRGSGQPKH